MLTIQFCGGGTERQSAGRPQTRLITADLKRMLEQEAPAANGRTWAAVIAEALLKKACKGDVRAIAELANRIEGKARQTVIGVSDGTHAAAWGASDWPS